MIQLVYFVFNAYALGLVVFTLCSWVKHEKVKAIEEWLGLLYAPVLRQVCRVVKPLKLGATHIDITPMILLFGIIVVRKVVIFILLMPY